MAFVNEEEKDRVVDYERNISMERANNPFGLTYKNPEAGLLSTWDLCLDELCPKVVYEGFLIT
jgi:hypothetical protein